MAASIAVRGAGLLTNFWKTVEAEIRAAGGNDEHLATLDTKKALPAIREFAKLVVGTVVRSFRGVIADGHYTYLYGFADNPEEIKGQTPHEVTKETELDHPGMTLTTQQVWERYSENMASLSEFLDFTARNPSEYWIGIVWKDEIGQFWYAYVDRNGSERDLVVSRGEADGRWYDFCRFLRRK